MDLWRVRCPAGRPAAPDHTHTLPDGACDATAADIVPNISQTAPMTPIPTPTLAPTEPPPPPTFPPPTPAPR